MPTERPRIQVTLDDHSNGLLSILANQQHLSKSTLAADLIREALELREDAALSTLADTRLKQAKRWVSHTDAWGDA